MSKIKLSIPVLVFALVALCKTATAQFEHPMFSSFDKDSLVGFDENAARAQAISERFLGPEFKIKMYRLKREYIDQKYGIVHEKSPHLVDINTYLNSNRPAASPGCVNEDFEASTAGPVTASNQVTGWVVTGGSNNPYLPTNPSTTGYDPFFPNGLPGVTSCNLLGCCPKPPAHSEIIDCSPAGGYIDNTIGPQYHIYSVFGTGTVSGANAANPQISTGLFGNKVLRLNDEITGDYSLEKLSKTFSVSAQNALFQFAFISVFAPGHGCCDAGGFQIRLSNATAGTVIPCPNFSVSAPSGACTATVPITYYNCGNGTQYVPSANTYSNIYHPWKINSMDLTAYIGQNITIDIIVSDCNAGGHFGCVYFDAQCGPMTVYGNSNPYDAGSNVTVPTCGAAGATICAADGLGPYSWAGPNLGPNYSIPSMTNQCITATVSASYTLYMQPEGSCVPISRVVNSTITPAPLLNASVAQATCGGTQAVVTLTPSGSAAVPSSLLWSPTPLALSQNTLVGTYTTGPTGTQSYTASITASDPLGCKITTTVQIQPAPPNPTFAIQNVSNSPSITCATPTVTLAAVTNYSYNNGTLSYFWASPSSTLVTDTVFAQNAGTYTVVATDNITQCSVIHTLTLFTNTIAPVSVMNPTFQNITCNLTSVQTVTMAATPSVNVTHMIVAPQGGTFSASSYSTSYIPGGIGHFTYYLRNDINGCVSQKIFTVTSSDGFPTFNVTSPQNFSLGCSSRSCAVISIDGGNTSQPQGGAVSYTVIPPGSPSTTPAGNLSTNNVYTVCSPGTYTVITKDNSNFCETRVPVSILQNTFAPNISTTVDRVVLDCNVPRVTLKGASTTGSTSLTWIFEGTPNTQQSDTITSFAITTNTAATHVNTYTLMVEDQSSKCRSFSVTTISQNLFPPKPLISNATPSLSCKTPTTILTNVSATGIPSVTGYPANLPVVGYSWGGPTPQEPLESSSTYTAQTVGVYSMTAKDLNNGCTAVATITIGDNRIYPNLSTSKFVDTLDCGVLNKLLKVNVSNMSSGAVTYTWVTSATQTVSSVNQQQLLVQSAGEYAVVVSNSVSGCTSIGSFSVVNGTLTAGFTPNQTSGYAPLTVNFVNNSASSQASNIGITSSWNFGNGTTSGSTTPTGTFVPSPIAASINPSATYNQPGTYTVTMYTTRGSCLDTAMAIIHVDIPSVMEVPNVFTPNSDGVNDFFFIHAKNLTEIRMTVFDRWGHKVYELTSTTGNIEWDGKNLQGKEAAEGVYFYTIKATGKDDKTYDKKGTINLFR